MRGFPKVLNSKQDYLNCLKDFPDETKADLQRLLDTRYSFFDVAVIANEGLNDDTHRVVSSDDDKIQQELKENPNAEIFRKGFTVQEVEEKIKNS